MEIPLKQMPAAGWHVVHFAAGLADQYQSLMRQAIARTLSIAITDFGRSRSRASSKSDW